MSGEFSLAGTKFFIDDTQITGLSNFPDLGTTAQRIKVTSMDDTQNERYIKGLKDTSDFSFEFNNEGTNYTSASSTAGDETHTYKLQFPDGSGKTWQGTHDVTISGGSVGGFGKFKIGCIVNSDLDDIA